jgi:hypothetical protein
MTESLSLALFVWAVVFFADFVRRAKTGEELQRAERSLWWCALVLSGEMLTRYDGWFLASAMFVVLLVFLMLRDLGQSNQGNREPGTGNSKTGTETQGTGNGEQGTENRKAASATWRAVVLRFAVLIALVPVFWFTYNYRLFGNPLEFANGPYSAKAIAERTRRAGEPPYPGKDHPVTAAAYLVKSGVLNLGGSRLEGEYGWWWRKRWQQDGWFLVLLMGTMALLLLRRSGRDKSTVGQNVGRPVWPLLLLWVPLPFYALSIAYGGVPIFIPSWWPYSYYNVRYGLQLLPAAAVCMAAMVVYGRWWKTVALVALTFVVMTYRGTWRTDPICLREAMVNSQTREQLESKLAEALTQLPPEENILMSTGDHVGALERAGVPLKQTINENNYYAWHEALHSPAKLADYAVAFGDDDVSKAVRNNGAFVPEQTITVDGQKTAVLYRRK